MRCQWKFYRVACFKEIGGFVRQVLWDGIDCHRAHMLGWIAESIDLESIRFVHLRPRGASHNGAFGPGGFGLASGSTSWAPRPFTYLSRANLPGAVGSMAMLWGYLRSWLKGLPRVQAFPPLLSARLPANGQAGRHGQGHGRARPLLACQSPWTLMRRR